MKTLILIASMVSSEIVYQEIHANDPGYGINNYKHVNKARAIAKKDTNKGVRVSFDETYRDYKKSAVRGKENVLQIFRNTDDREYLKRKNYKMPNG